MNIAEQVGHLIVDCLFKTEEEARAALESGEAKVTEGIIRMFVLDPKKVAEHREEIRALLDQMPDTFHSNGGGGWTFLNLCIDKEGKQWTGMQATMEELVVLGIAAGLAEYCLPRDAWGVLPGRMPYVVFYTEKIDANR